MGSLIDQDSIKLSDRKRNSCTIDMHSLVREIALNYMRSNTLINALEVIIVALFVTLAPMGITYTTYD